jgi:hypothetical protein
MTIGVISKLNKGRLGFSAQHGNLCADVRVVRVSVCMLIQLIFDFTPEINTGFAIIEEQFVMPSPPLSSTVSSVTVPKSLIEPSVLFSHLGDDYLTQVGGMISSRDPKTLSDLNNWTELAGIYLGSLDERTYQPVETLGDKLFERLREIESDDENNNEEKETTRVDETENRTDSEDDNDEEVNRGVGEIRDALEFPKIIQAYIRDPKPHGAKEWTAKRANEYLESMEGVARKNYDDGAWLEQIDSQRLANAMAIAGVDHFLDLGPHRDLIRRIYVWQQKQLKIHKGDEVKRKRDDDGSGDEVPPKEKKLAFHGKTNHSA